MQAGEQSALCRNVYGGEGFGDGFAAAEALPLVMFASRVEQQQVAGFHFGDAALGLLDLGGGGRGERLIGQGVNLSVLSRQPFPRLRVSGQAGAEGVLHRGR